MRVFVAPDPDELDLAAYVGDRDFTYARAGELLVPPVLVCDGAQERDRCGCGRSMTGVESMRGTSLAQVREMGRPEVARRLEGSVLVKEWGPIAAPSGDFLGDMKAATVMVSLAIQNAEGVEGDVFRVENGPNDAASFTITRAR